MTENKTSRRNLLGSITAFAFGVLFGSKGYAQVMTPHSTEGPYYPRPNMRMADVDRDLVRVIGQVRQAGGEVITLRGKVCDRNGSPRAGLRVEIWQCDLNGSTCIRMIGKTLSTITGFRALAMTSQTKTANSDLGQLSLSPIPVALRIFT